MVDKVIGQNIFPQTKQSSPTAKKLFPASEQLPAGPDSDFKNVLGRMLAEGTKNFREHPLGFFVSPEKALYI